MIKDKKYWTKQLETTDSQTVLAEVRSLLDSDNKAALNGLLVLVEAITSEQRSLVSLIMQLAVHLYLLKYASRENGDYENNKNHWNNEVKNHTINLQALLLETPSLKPKIQGVLNEVMPSAKKLAFNHMKGKMPSVKSMENLGMDEVFPPFLFPNLKKYRSKG